ncbi:MAG: tRNA guanosine(34) transglycosylase Tgt [Chloroflexi bacterium]|nr:tRNA guanosine(34) transglycosylase Tgt [Chloroflexota bacterium]
MQPASFAFRIQATCGLARAGVLATPRGAVPTPAFMPVASQGSVKALAPEEVRGCGTSILLANTYHLYLRPGVEVIQRLGGLHRFMGWDGPILTDSGGYQVFSLGELRQVTEDGVLFASHLDGSRHLLSPEDVIRYQEALGADLITCLDHCLPYPADEEATRSALERTLRWARRCQEAHAGHEGVLLGILQGGHSKHLRQSGAAALTALGFAGYAVGGLSVGEPKALMYETAAFSAELLPKGQLRYLMGVGSPEDLVECVGLGYDLFDCALPTRVARTGALYTPTGRVDVTASRFREQEGPVQEGCDCYTCTRFSAAYLHHLFKARELLAYRLATLHNLRFYQRLMAGMRQAILDGTFDRFRRAFLSSYRPADEATRIQQRGRRGTPGGQRLQEEE